MHILRGITGNNQLFCMNSLFKIIKMSTHLLSKVVTTQFNYYFHTFTIFGKLTRFSLPKSSIRKRKHCCIFCMRLTLWHRTLFGNKSNTDTNLIKYPKSLLFDFIKILTSFSQKYFYWSFVLWTEMDVITMEKSEGLKRH